uniref:Uncharacterized protein n=1 Tax=Onchocerca volvulus TaxID=6282 RepID=A0A8R1XQM2_ONCVO
MNFNVLAVNVSTGMLIVTENRIVRMAPMRCIVIRQHKNKHPNRLLVSLLSFPSCFFLYFFNSILAFHRF